MSKKLVYFQSKGVDQLRPGSDINSALSEAVIQKNAVVVEQLLKQGADPNIMHSDGKPLLYSAVSNKLTVIVRLLTTYGARIESVDDRIELFTDAAKHECFEMILILATPYKFDNQTMLAALNRVWYDDLDAATALLNLCDKTIQSYVMQLFAKPITREEFLCTLQTIKQCKINIPSQYRKNALDLAFKYPDDQSIGALIECGISQAAIITLATRLLTSSTDRDTLKYALTTIENLVGYSGVDFHKHGETPVFYAARQGYNWLIRMLKDYNVDIDACNIDGESPLFFAAKHGHVNVIKRLIKYGANPNCVNSKEETPIFYAAKQRHTLIVERLIKYGADPNITNVVHKTASYYLLECDVRENLILAINVGYDNVVRKLLELNDTDIDYRSLLTLPDQHGKTIIYYIFRTDMVEKIKSNTQLNQQMLELMQEYGDQLNIMLETCQIDLPTIFEYMQQHDIAFQWSVSSRYLGQQRQGSIKLDTQHAHLGHRVAIEKFLVHECVHAVTSDYYSYNGRPYPYSSEDDPGKNSGFDILCKQVQSTIDTHKHTRLHSSNLILISFCATLCQGFEYDTESGKHTEVPARMAETMAVFGWRNTVIMMQYHFPKLMAYFEKLIPDQNNDFLGTLQPLLKDVFILQNIQKSEFNGYRSGTIPKLICGYSAHEYSPQYVGTLLLDYNLSNPQNMYTDEIEMAVQWAAISGETIDVICDFVC
ncbi:MAG: hypothetical protein COA94_06755 [Rickettsiales bacterium]|nr:MAG: hypothetical protein COA94_06755 [Rickettsiales bacterium]